MRELGFDGRYAEAVIAGLDPAIHRFARTSSGRRWMRGSSPRMTGGEALTRARIPTSAPARVPRPRGTVARSAESARRPIRDDAGSSMSAWRRSASGSTARCRAAPRRDPAWACWIDGRAENPREDHHAAVAGIDAMSEGPFDLLVVGGVDVLLHHDHVLVAVLGGAVAPERGRDLLRLPLVVLLDLDADVDAVGDRRGVDVEDAGDAGAVEDVPGDPRPLHRGHHAVLAVGAGQRALERAAEDRVPAGGDA